MLKKQDKIILAIVLGLLCLSCCLSLALPNKNVQVVSLDTHAIVREFIKLHSKKEMTNLQITQCVKKFSSRLDTVLSELEQEHHWIIFPKSTVIAGGHDITADVSQRIFI